MTEPPVRFWNAAGRVDMYVRRDVVMVDAHGACDRVGFELPLDRLKLAVAVLEDENRRQGSGTARSE